MAKNVRAVLTIQPFHFYLRANRLPLFIIDIDGIGESQRLYILTTTRNFSQKMYGCIVANQDTSRSHFSLDFACICRPIPGSMSTLPAFAVPVQSHQIHLSSALLRQANLNELPQLWTCDWKTLWEQSDFEYQAIMALAYEQKVFGLIKFSLYGDNDVPEILEINNLETFPSNDRPINPVGVWLIWYACKMALIHCTGNKEGSMVVLDAVEDAIPYYQEKVMMEGLGWTTIAPGEDGYAFRFTRDGAEQFCARIESTYGIPDRK